MSKLIAHIFVGMILVAILMTVNEFLVPESLYMSDAFNHFMTACYCLSIIIPCVIYYLKTPRGTDNRGQR
jgi:hypothetical protein